MSHSTAHPTDLIDGPPLVSARSRLCDLVEAHHDFIWRALRRLGTPESAVDDLAQRVFLVAFRKLEKIEPGKERSFLYSIAIRMSRAEWRKHRSHPRSETDLDELATAHPGPDVVAQQRQALEILQVTLDGMPTPLREVFVLYEFEELSTYEIAGVLSIARGTVCSRLRRARQVFRLAVAPYVDEVQP